jgi:dipeptidyl aminopeptidase/acylaminoacyl peptidase
MNTLTVTGPVSTIAEQVDIMPNSGIAHFSAANNGTLIYRTVAGLNRQLTWINRAGQTVGTPGERALYTLVKVSPDASKAAVVRIDTRAQPPNSDIWIVDLATGGSTRFTFDPASDSQPVWSPDGTAVAWQSNRGKAPGIYRKAINGSGSDELLATPDALNNLTDWSRDGYLIYATRGQIWALPAAADANGKRTPVPAVTTQPAGFGAYVSPDNRWIAYISTETGRQEIFVQPFAPGNKMTGKWQVSNGAIGMARWRADGKELMFVAADGSIVSVDVNAGPSAFQASAPHNVMQFPRELLAVNPNLGTLVDVTRDNQRLLTIMPVQESSQREIQVVMNWPAAIRK